METIEALRFSFYILFHPFEGFWAVKFERRGNFRTATLIVYLLILYSIVSRQWTGFPFNAHADANVNVFREAIGIYIPFLLWCIANWSVTTLLDGEGTFRDIYVASAYALVPILLIGLPMILVSNIIVLEESRLYSALTLVSAAWSCYLMFAGLITIHQYTVRRTLFTILIAIVAMAAILFLFLLFFALIQQVLNFFYIAYIEMTQRLL